MSKNGENPGGQVKLICLPDSPGTAGLYTGSGDHRTHSCPQIRAQIWTSCQWPPSFRSPWWRRNAVAAGPSLHSCKHGCTEWGETFNKKKNNLLLSGLKSITFVLVCWEFNVLHIVIDDTLLTGSRHPPMCVRWRDHVLRWESGCWTSDEGCEGTQRGGHIKGSVWMFGGEESHLSLHGEDLLERILYRNL